MTLAVPAGASERLRHYIDTAAMLLGMIPANSSRKVTATLRRFVAFTKLMEITEEDVSEAVVLAYVVYRVARAPGDPVLRGASPYVSATTAASDVDSLRRGLQAGDGRWRFLAEALRGPRINALLKQIGGREKKDKTCKAPLLMREVVNEVDTAVETCGKVKDPSEASDTQRRSARDAFAVSLLFFCALRCSELLAINVDDISRKVTADGTEYLEVRLEVTKTSQGRWLKANKPGLVHSAAPYLFRALEVYGRVVGRRGSVPAFVGSGRAGPRAADGRASRSWLEATLRRVSPESGATPHSGRVGFATEAWAAGVPLQTIMQVGRWKSLAALIYVLGDVDAALKASLQIGSAALTRERVSQLGLTDRKAGPRPPPVGAGEDVPSSDSG